MKGKIYTEKFWAKVGNPPRGRTNREILNGTRFREGGPGSNTATKTGVWGGWYQNNCLKKNENSKPWETQRKKFQCTFVSFEIAGGQKKNGFHSTGRRQGP